MQTFMIYAHHITFLFPDWCDYRIIPLHILIPLGHRGSAA